MSGDSPDEAFRAEHIRSGSLRPDLIFAYGWDSMYEMIVNMKRAVRERIRRGITQKDNPSPEEIRRAAEGAVRQVQEDLAAGKGKSSAFYAFETAYEELSDSIWSLCGRGEVRACREILGELYSFVTEMMADTNMLICLFISYRYALVTLISGDSREAMGIFRTAMDDLDRMIGSGNVYMIRLLEGYGQAARASGQEQEAGRAQKRMLEIAAQITEGENCLLGEAVKRRIQRRDASKDHTVNIVL